jgi:hypothetical protein
LLANCILPCQANHLLGDEGSHFRIGFGRASLPEVLAEIEGFLTE